MKTLVVLREVEDKVCELLREKNIDEVVKVIINYLASHRIIIYEKPNAIIYDFDILQRPIMTLFFSNFAISIKESHIYIEPLVRLDLAVKFPFED